MGTFIDDFAQTSAFLASESEILYFSNSVCKVAPFNLVKIDYRKIKVTFSR